MSSVANRRMVEMLLEDVDEAMEGTSLRVKNAAARVWGCLSAVGQDERSVGDQVFRNALGWTEEGGTPGVYSRRVGVEVGGGGAVGAISSDALCVAREGTLMNTVLTGLQSVATFVDNVGDGLEGKATRDALAPARPSLFAASAMACLEACPTLRVPHSQMAVVIEALFRGGHGVEVETRCISLALALADRERAYSTWLRGLSKGQLFLNLSQGARRHLVLVLDQVALKMPTETIWGLIEDVWTALTSKWFARMRRCSASGEGVAFDDSECISQAAAFLASLGRLAWTATAAAAAAYSHVASVTTTSVLPSILGAFAVRDVLAVLDGGAPEAPLWDALVGLLSHLSRRDVEDAIGFKPGDSARLSSVDRCQEAIRAYLTSRLAAAEGAMSATAAKTSAMAFSVSPSSSSSSPSAAPAAAAAAGLGGVARWATRTLTDRRASAVVLPHLAEGLNCVNAATGARGAWFQTLLDMAGLPESCSMRATALVGGAAAVCDPSKIGFLVVGEKADDLFGRDEVRRRRYQGGALLYAMSLAAPRAVARAEKLSSGVSAEVLARLLRLSGLLHRREGVTGADEGGKKELEEVRLGVEGFVRGLRHAPPVLSGTMSRQYASYAESVAAERALS